MEIHQVIVTAAPGDAITNAALEIRSLLRRVGPSEIFARNRDVSLVDDVCSLQQYDDSVRRSRDNVLIFHASIGEPLVLSFLLERPERVVLVYHNITPAEYFEPYDPVFARLLADGRDELTMLRDRALVALADSEYNARELEMLGYRDVRVSPLIIDVGALHGVEPAALPRDLAERDGPLILFVGQLHPHKRPDLLVEAFHVLATYLLPGARLALVGPSRLGRYKHAIERLVAELNLTGAHILGPIPTEELVALYRAADMFVTMSEHEGFCVPLVEAMAFDTPAIGRARAAIPDTLGDAGLVLPPTDDPCLAAEAMRAVYEDADLARGIVERGRTRLASFEPDTARARFVDHLTSVL